MTDAQLLAMQNNLLAKATDSDLHAIACIALLMHDVSTATLLLQNYNKRLHAAVQDDLRELLQMYAQAQIAHANTAAAYMH